MPKISYALSIFLFFLISVSKAQISNGSGSYAITTSGPPSSEGPFVTANFDKPIMTTDWWTSILWSHWQNPSGFSNILHPQPFSAQCTANGLTIGYANTPNIFNGNAGTSFDNNYNYDYTADITVGLEGVTFTETNVEDYSDWDVLANWQSGSDILRARMGHGFTYTYFTKSGNKNVTISTSANVSIEGNALRITEGNKHYAVFAPTGATWSGSNGSYQSSLDGENYWSVALLPDDSDATFNNFEQYAFAFISKTEVTYQVDIPNGKIHTDFNVTYDNKEGNASASYFALYRHQWLHTNQVNTNYTYVSPRGAMKVVEGNNFSTTMDNIGSLPLLPTTSGSYNEATLSQLVTEFANRPSYNCQGTGCNSSYYGNYTMGRFLIQAGQVALIANEIGDNTSRDKIVNWMKDELEDFFTFSNDGRYLAYNETWDITINMSENIEHCSIECLNDRNIQYGYWVRAAAIVAQFNTGWANDQQWGPMVDMYIKDVANFDRSDDMFPFMRNFDVYAGHSWALGFSDLPEGADQESSSESLNFASALIYYGQITGRQEYVEQGMWLYTTEVVGTEQYWFDVEEEVFPDGFYPEMLGLIRSSGGFYQLWWQLLPEHVLMVNCFPWTGGALYLGRFPDACQRIYEWIETGAGNNGHTKWHGYLWPYLALYDADRAVSEYNALNYDYDIEIEAEANNYYWLYTMQKAGQIDRSITSNVASSLVFNNNGHKMYAVFNPPGAGQRFVDFSDGNRFDCPDNVLIFFDEDDAVPVEDCAGVEGGSAYIDACGECVGGTTGKDPCPTDCQGVPNGNAYLDNCDRCVGGTTNLEPCTQDCNDEWGGTAFIDSCNICVGGSTGKAPCVIDCNGDINGGAFIDGCGECVGGNTGKEACLAALFTANTYQAAPNEQVTFSDESAGDNIVSYSWDFGLDADPETATGIGPHNVTYSTTGVKTITLTITTSQGHSDSYSRNINIAAASCDAAYVNDFSDGIPTMNSYEQFTNTNRNNQLPSSALSFSAGDNSLLITADGSENASAVMALGANLNIQSDPRLMVKVRASKEMALRITIRDINNTTALTDDLQEAPNSFDLIVNTEWQEFTINFEGNFMDSWIFTGNALNPQSITHVEFIPHPEEHPISGFDNVFEGQFEVDYVLIGGDASACLGGIKDCFGIPNGTATVDQCGVCSGGQTGVPVDDCVTVGNEDLFESSSTVNAFPSPFNDEFIINSEGFNSGDNTLLELYSSDGVSIYSGTYKMGDKISASANWPSGMYHGRIISKNAVHTFSIVKK